MEIYGGSISLIRPLARAILAVVVIRIVAAVFALTGSLVGAFNNNIRIPIVLAILSFATLANISLLIVALILTVNFVDGLASLNSLGQAFGVDWSYGQSYLIIEWVGAACSLVGTVYWLSVWLVEYRQFSLSRISRDPDSIGDWSGILAELRKDWHSSRDVKYGVSDDERHMLGRRGRKRIRKS